MIRRTKEAFYDIAQFPNVVGAVDGTLIPIISPSRDEHVYVCRKGYHAINVQGVVDAEMRFTNAVAKWPGSVHDSFIWTNSTLCRRVERGEVDGWLLGDSGYPLRPWLLTPVLNPSTAGQHNYNHAHIKTRNVIERPFGLCKSRFRHHKSSYAFTNINNLICNSIHQLQAIGTVDLNVIRTTEILKMVMPSYAIYTESTMMDRPPETI
ncbi:putative nuclease HARBI1 [Argopecten irradians]|uniref:putative nuclease HARBI1 n=1 Tax=Argopecten irradians TaxID=31199 RepID=UPI0037237EC3